MNQENNTEVKDNLLDAFENPSMVEQSVEQPVPAVPVEQPVEQPVSAVPVEQPVPAVPVEAPVEQPVPAAPVEAPVEQSVPAAPVEAPVQSDENTKKDDKTDEPHFIKKNIIFIGIIFVLIILFIVFLDPIMDFFKNLF